MFFFWFGLSFTLLYLKLWGSAPDMSWWLVLAPAGYWFISRALFMRRVYLASKADAELNR